jgi:hypothetical protein
MEDSTFLSSFEVGDLVTLKHYPGSPIGVVVSLATLMFNRMMIVFNDGTREMVEPGHWKVVSRNAIR